MLQYPVPYAYPLCYSATYLADCDVAICISSSGNVSAPTITFALGCVQFELVIAVWYVPEV